MSNAVVAFTGWGRGSWNQIEWGQGSITNSGAAASVGSVTVTAGANVEAASTVGYTYNNGVSISVSIEAPVTGLVASINSDPSSTVNAQAILDVTSPTLTGSSGAVTLVTEVNYEVNGFEASASVGSGTVAADANTSVLGVGASGTINSVNLVTNQNLEVSGLSASLGTPSVTVTADANTTVTGLSGTSANNGVSLSTEVNQLVSGLEATSGTESVVITADANVLTAGVGASSNINDVSITSDANVGVTSPVINTVVGQVLVYGSIVPNQNPEYSSLAPAQDANWQDLAA